jgi:hypothetical protein
MDPAWMGLCGLKPSYPLELHGVNREGEPVVMLPGPLACQSVGVVSRCSR